MKTALVCTAWLDNQEYYEKTIKFVKYHEKFFPLENIFIFDNGSTGPNKTNLKCNVLTQYPHYDREAHLVYRYIWRTLYSIKYLFDMGYEKVLYMNDDSYIISNNMMNWVDTSTGWCVPYCNRFNFPECEIQVITNCSEYQKFVEDGKFWKHDGLHMELTIPFTNVNKTLIGDRYNQYPTPLPIPDNADFCTQVPLHWEMK